MSETKTKVRHGYKVTLAVESEEYLTLDNLIEKINSGDIALERSYFVREGSYEGTSIVVAKEK